MHKVHCTIILTSQRRLIKWRQRRTIPASHHFHLWISSFLFHSQSGTKPPLTVWWSNMHHHPSHSQSLCSQNTHSFICRRYALYLALTFGGARTNGFSSSFNLMNSRDKFIRSSVVTNLFRELKRKGGRKLRRNCFECRTKATRTFQRQKLPPQFTWHASFAGDNNTRIFIWWPGVRITLTQRNTSSYEFEWFRRTKWWWWRWWTEWMHHSFCEDLDVCVCVHYPIWNFVPFLFCFFFFHFWINSLEDCESLATLRM